MRIPPDPYPPAGPDLADFWAGQPSGVIREMLRTAAHFALSDLGIRILGEKGTGKWFLARMIHRESPRSGSLFLRVNCSEIPQDRVEKSIFGAQDPEGPGLGPLAGILETARGGTVYFDFFEHLPAPIQDRLFRAMELRHFRRIGGSDDLTLDVRVITSVTKVPGQVAAWGGSSNLAVTRPGPVSINVPPLREHREDIEFLIYLFLREFQKNIGENVIQVTAETLELCRNYAWPGNIYELRNVVRHSMALAAGGELRPGDLPEYIRSEVLQARSAEHAA
jgi:DNA-binding NtrC family response regulator